MKLNIYKLGYFSLSVAALGDQSSQIELATHRDHSAADMHDAGNGIRALRIDNDRVLIDLNQRSLVEYEQGHRMLDAVQTQPSDTNWGSILGSAPPTSQPVGSLPVGGNPKLANEAPPSSVANPSASANPNASAPPSGSIADAPKQGTKKDTCAKHNRFSCLFIWHCRYDRNVKLCQQKPSKVLVKE